MADQVTVIGQSAGQLAAGIRAGALSSVEVVAAHIDQIEAQHERLHAMVLPLFEQAREAAKAADEARAAGAELGPLHGVPITIKAQFLVAGSETTMGLLHRQGGIDPADGPLIARLRRAGAIIVGKSNIMQMLLGYESDNPLYGRSNNPWNTARTPGGSSGGEGALIATGMPLGMGGDFGGSIRIPAHFCGIHGLKPTARRLPNDDTPVMDFFEMGQQAIIPQPGPMARTVDDLVLAMSILAGPYDEPLLDRVPPVPWAGPEGIDVSSLRIGVFDDNGFFRPSPAVRRAVREAAGHLADLGASVVEFPAPDARAALGLFLDIVTADGGRATKRALGPDAANHLLKPIQQGAAMPRPMRMLLIVRAIGTEPGHGILDRQPWRHLPVAAVFGSGKRLRRLSPGPARRDGRRWRRCPAVPAFRHRGAIARHDDGAVRRRQLCRAVQPHRLPGRRGGGDPGAAGRRKRPRRQPGQGGAGGTGL